MRASLLAFALLAASFTMNARSDKPFYHEIPEAPDSYTGPHVAARLLDGLGFRYFWATEGLRAEDLAYAPGEGRRSTGDTIDHIYLLALIAAHATQGKPTVYPIEPERLSFTEKRTATLANIKAASDNLKRATEQDMESFKMIFQQANGDTSAYPFWNAINGPIADAVWHCGQIVSFRRSSGNPFSSNLSLLRGSVRE